VLIAGGTEEMEAVTIIDILRRAHVDVVVVAVREDNENKQNNPGLEVRCSRGVTLVADIELDDLSDVSAYGIVVLPGGSVGADTFSRNWKVLDLVRLFFNDKKKYVAAICASPIVLKEAGIAQGYSITSYPSYKDKLSDSFSYVDNEPVVIDRNIITSRGPATSIYFALAIVQTLLGVEVKKSITKDLLV